MATVTFERVTKHIGNVTAVRDFSLEVRDGECLVLAGPSGCGKTTVLRLLAGLEHATSGDLFIGARRVNDVPPKDRDTAMAFQNAALYPRMSAFENIAFGLKLRGTPGDEIASRVARVADMLGLTPLLARTTDALSGGERQRVSLARVIAREPAVLLLDEPLADLDPPLRLKARAALQALQRRLRPTTIYATHDQAQAAMMGDRIAVMNEGILQQVDTPEAVQERPANPFVAGFIGSPKLDVIDKETEVAI